MPSPSYYPVAAAMGMPIMGWGVYSAGTTQIALITLGGLLTIGALVGWVLEPTTETETH